MVGGLVLARSPMWCSGSPVGSLLWGSQQAARGFNGDQQAARGFNGRPGITATFGPAVPTVVVGSSGAGSLKLDGC